MWRVCIFFSRISEKMTWLMTFLCLKMKSVPASSQKSVSCYGASMSVQMYLFSWWFAWVVLNSFGNSEFFSQINSMKESEITKSLGYLKRKNRALSNSFCKRMALNLALHFCRVPFLQGVTFKAHVRSGQTKIGKKTRTESMCTKCSVTSIALKCTEAPGL